MMREKDVLQREFTMQPSIAAAANTLVQLEKSMDYPAVAAGYEVITDQRSTVVIDQGIAVGIRSGERFAGRRFNCTAYS